MIRKLICTLTAAAFALGASLHALADTTPEDAADYRTAVMTTLRGHLVASSMIIRGLVDDRGQIVGHAHGLASSIDELPHIFPAGSNIGDSEALPAIWEDEEGFAAAIEKATDAVDEFVAAAEGGDKEAIGAAFRNVGGACRGCHDNYRVDHD